jgi:hypothetical protein
MPPRFALLKEKLMKRLTSIARRAILATALTALFALPGRTIAADHADSPSASQDPGADIADVFAFLDPNDNSKVCLIMTVHGFIPPGEAMSFATFDPNVRFRFGINDAGDVNADKFIDVIFAPKRAGAGDPQIATVTLPNGKTFDAASTAVTDAPQPNPPVITKKQGVTFFAGETDDPFFFDLPAFTLFIQSVVKGHPDPTIFNRGRDTFAGYNVLAIALEIPAVQLKGKSNKIGVFGLTQRKTQRYVDKGGVTTSGSFVQVDRMGNPAVNVALIPFLRKDEFNAASQQEIASGKFTADILSTLTLLGTDAAHKKILNDIVLKTGDALTLDLNIPNAGPGGGDNPAASYPNGRRLKDDTPDIVITVINNGNHFGDNVNANDVPLRDSFPFLAPPQQPRPTGTIDDNTRN